MLKMLASYFLESNTPSHVTTIILACEAGGRCVQTTIFATKLKKAVN